ncbi:MAG: lytic transglycosylase domain-containing protein [Candidatus Pacearchaeota archaeon]
MKNSFARDIVESLRENWKKYLFIALIGGATLSAVKLIQAPQEPRKTEKSSSLDSLTDAAFNRWFKPIQPETLSLEFFIFKDAPEYNHLDAIAKDYPKARDYIPIVQQAIKDNKHVFPLDAVLVLGKIEAESGFEKFVISSVGAGGPSQLMPSTAQSYGLKVYYPEYLKEAYKLNSEANNLYRNSISLFLSKEFELAKATYLEYEKKQKKADSLFSYYRKDLLSQIKNQPDSVIKKIDERFIIEKAIPAGVNYYALMFRKFKGDVRMSISAYNCGQRPVERANGIPYIKETVGYQNRIINFYKKYHKKCL